MPDNRKFKGRSDFLVSIANILQAVGEDGIKKNPDSMLAGPTPGGQTLGETADPYVADNFFAKGPVNRLNADFNANQMAQHNQSRIQIEAARQMGLISNEQALKFLGDRIPIDAQSAQTLGDIETQQLRQRAGDQVVAGQNIIPGDDTNQLYKNEVTRPIIDSLVSGLQSQTLGNRVKMAGGDNQIAAAEANSRLGLTSSLFEEGDFLNKVQQQEELNALKMQEAKTRLLDAKFRTMPDGSMLNIETGEKVYAPAESYIDTLMKQRLGATPQGIEDPNTGMQLVPKGSTAIPRQQSTAYTPPTDVPFYQVQTELPERLPNAGQIRAQSMGPSPTALSALGLNSASTASVQPQTRKLSNQPKAPANIDPNSIAELLKFLQSQ